MYKLIKAIVVLALVIAFGAAVFLYNIATEPTVNERIVVSSSDFALSGFLFLAQEQALFKKNGLEVVIDIVPSGKQGIEAMFAQKSQLAMAAETPIMMSIMNGKKIVVLGSLGESVGDNAVVGRIDHGIKTPDDLLGKSIAVEVGTSGEYFLDTLLISRRIDRSQVTIVPTSTDKITELLLAGKVDAGAGWPPYVLNWQQQLAMNAVTFNNPSYLAMTWCITATPDYVATHQDTLKKFFRTLAEAEQHFKKKPEDMRRILLEQRKVDSGLLDLNIYRFSLRFDQSIAVNLEGLTQWAMKRGMVQQRAMPNYLDFFVTEPLKAVNPEAVTIVR